MGKPQIAFLLEAYSRSTAFCLSTQHSRSPHAESRPESEGNVDYITG